MAFWAARALFDWGGVFSYDSRMETKEEKVPGRNFLWAEMLMREPSRARKWLGGQEVGLTVKQFREEITSLGPTEFVKEASLKQDFEIFVYFLARSEKGLPRESMEEIFGFLESEEPVLRATAGNVLADLVALDMNGKGEDFLNLPRRLHEILAEKLCSSSKKDQDIVFWITEAGFGSGYVEGLLEAFLEAFERVDDAEALKGSYAVLANHLGLGEMRKFLKGSRLSSERLDWIERMMAIDPQKENFFRSLKKLYESMLFEEYPPNEELNDFEAGFLGKELGEGLALDLGFGPAARHMESLKRQGKLVVGVDFVPLHAQKAMEKLGEDSGLTVASWKNLPIKAESVDLAYCLGRGALHNSTVDGWLRFFRETFRVLKGGGKLILDLPDLTRGDYARELARMHREAEEKGLFFKEEGLIVDSPDGKRFFDRLAPWPEQLKAMAAWCGFRAEEVERRDYSGKDKEKNVNVYWRLTKEPRELSEEEESVLLGTIYTGRQPLFLRFY